MGLHVAGRAGITGFRLPAVAQRHKERHAVQITLTTGADGSDRVLLICDFGIEHRGIVGGAITVAGLRQTQGGPGGRMEVRPTPGTDWMAGCTTRVR